MKNIYRKFGNGFASYVTDKDTTVLVELLEDGVKVSFRMDQDYTKYLPSSSSPLFDMVIKEFTRLVHELGVHECHISKNTKDITIVILDKYGVCNLTDEEQELVFQTHQDITDDILYFLFTGYLSTGELFMRTLNTLEVLGSDGSYAIYRDPKQIEHLLKDRRDTKFDPLSFIELREQFLSQLKGTTYELNGDNYVEGNLIQVTDDTYSVKKSPLTDEELRQFKKLGEIAHYPLYAFNL